MPSPLEIAKALERALQFRDVRKTARQIVKDFEASEDYLLGKRENIAFYSTLRDFEPKGSKLIKSSDAIAATNMIAGNFMTRIWPLFIKTKIEEFVLSKATGEIAKRGVAKKIAVTSIKGVSGWIGALFGALTNKLIQEVEMRRLETSIRKYATATRKELNDRAMSQARKPSKIGKTVTRHG